MKTDNISVVMACYGGDKLEALKEAVDSVLNQTVKIAEFIIVQDGPVSEDISSYLMLLQQEASIVEVLVFEQNQGAAKARNIGMSKSKGVFIAIMDSDDILMPDRLELQLAAIKQHNVDAVWGWQEEFYDGTSEYAGTKTCPEFHDDIVKSLKWRCLLPDPTTFMKRCCFDKTGGYADFKDLNIDYKFFVKMALSDCNLYCVQKPLIKVRISSDQRKRRGGFALFRQDYIFRLWMLNNKLLSLPEFIFITFAFAVFRLQPNFMRDWVYRKILRR